MHPASTSNNYHYNKKLQSYANKLRQNLTKAEASLWKYFLRAGQLHGYKFRRQRPVLNYIADFMCTGLMLIIEVDGITHLDEKVVKKDTIRQKALKKVGFIVLRFNDAEVLNDMRNVERVLMHLWRISNQRRNVPRWRGSAPARGWQGGGCPPLAVMALT